MTSAGVAPAVGRYEGRTISTVSSTVGGTGITSQYLLLSCWKPTPLELRE